jgi:hypothetical protein
MTIVKPRHDIITAVIVISGFIAVLAASGMLH